MPFLSKEAKESIILKTLNRGTESIKSVAKRHNVAVSSLYTWLKHYRESAPIINQGDRIQERGKLTRVEKFNHLLATSQLDEVSLGTYCRENGLYSYQLMEWRNHFMSTPQTTNEPQARSELKVLKEENKRLRHDLRRKEKALAEASALLIMKKKADLIWGEDEDV